MKFRPSFPEGLVISTCPIASALGMRVLQEGGNAADAAVTVALALSVTYPQAGNLAGGGFAMHAERDGPAELLDYRETAPRNVHPGLYLDRHGRLTDRCRIGGAATATPGTVAGLAELRQRHGSREWDRLVAPVIELAETGYWLTNRQATYLQLYESELRRYDATARSLLRDGVAPLPGTRMPSPDLARTLRVLADEGPDSFYQGKLAETIVEQVQADGGVLDLDDMRDYRCRWREPLRGQYRDWEVMTTPPPSGGGFVVMATLAILERCKAHELPDESAERFDLIARALRVAFSFRRELLGDPDFLDEAAQSEITDFLYRRVQSDTLEQMESFVGDFTDAGDYRLSGNTTHFCIIDKNQRCVSNTYSLNTLFGNKLTVDGLGVLLNNSIDDFLIAPGNENWYGMIEGERNQLAPFRRPVGTMTPTIFRRPGSHQFTIGAAGGPRIASLVAQVGMRLISDGLSLPEAMQKPRVHHQRWPDALCLEDTAPEDVRQALQARGYHVSSVATLGIGTALYSDWEKATNAAVLDHRFSGAWSGPTD